VSLLENRGGNANGWIDVALEGLPTGSAKVNRLGYGSEVEARAQDLYVYRVVARPVTRLGLGNRQNITPIMGFFADRLQEAEHQLVPATRLEPEENS